MKKIVVTGGAGYIGSHTIVELEKNGFSPIIIDNLSNSSIKNINGINKLTKKDIKFYNADCTNQEEIRNIFNIEKNIAGIIHFAAFKSVEESVKDPLKYYKNNINSLHSILENMKEFNIQNIIFSSSCTVYGDPEELPVREKSPFNKATSPYGETKQKCEYILQESNTNNISLRYFNPIGCHSSSLIGDLSSDSPTNLIPIITEVAIKKRKQLVIFGDDYDTADGSCIRDYIHVVDLAKSHVKALKFILNNSGTYAFNIGTGKGMSVFQAIKSFEEANNIKINIKIGERRSGDIEKIYANAELAKNHLKWTAEKTIKEAMIDSWKWEKQKNDHA